jgi:hypothetical protein
MRIQYEERGGIAGITKFATIDTNHPSFSGESQEIHSMVDGSKFFTLPSKTAQPHKGAADYITYTITVETDDGQKHTVETTDGSKPPELNSLIGYLKRKAQPVRKNPT